MSKERLTETVFGYKQLKACENDFCKETCEQYDDEESCDNCPIQKAIEKLAEYEDLEDVLRGKLTDNAVNIITASKKDFSEWIDRILWTNKRCDELAREVQQYRELEEQGLLFQIPCRCKDCKHVDYGGCLGTTCYCMKHSAFMQEDDFCNHAEKDESEAEEKLRELEGK